MTDTVKSEESVAITPGHGHIKTPGVMHLPLVMKFVFGGLSGMGATMVVHPCDLLKTRMQVGHYKSPYDCVNVILTAEGYLGFYKGLSAALFRQATYTAARLGMYLYLEDMYINVYGKEPSMPRRMTMGTVAGAFGAFIGTPAEVALIRMQTDGHLPHAHRRNYTNVFNALSRITREEGLDGLCSGVVPTIIRAMVVNMTQLATYSQAKSFISQTYQIKEGFLLHFVAAMLSGLITAGSSMPVDLVKTRMQNMKYINGIPEYSSALDVVVKVIRREGVMSFYTGFLPYYGRVGTHTVLIFIYLENFKRLYFKYAPN